MKDSKKTASDQLIQKLLLLILITLGPVFSSAQKVEKNLSIENKLIKPYEQYFQQGREWVYTQLNKSAYLQGDDMWFTSYVLNTANKQLSVATSKLYIELWSPQKKLVSRKILFVKDGTSSHYIHLPDSLAPGSYCFRAYTNWMRNFYAEKDLSTSITILGAEKPLETTEKQNKKSADRKPDQISAKVSDWDIQLLPESGTFLEGADNVIAVKTTDSFGRGAKINGKVLTGDNNVIAVFSTNENGMGSFMIHEATNQKYMLRADLPDSTTRELPLPNAEPKGIVIQVNPFRTDVISFRLQTNNLTNQNNNTYFVTVHANGTIFKSYRFKFPGTNSIQFKINREELGNGIIYATVFDQDLTPVAERIFYNQDPNLKGRLTLKAEALPNDTVKMNVNVLDSLNNTEFSKLSLSVLPGETCLSQFNNSLLAESILRPALQGQIENPNSYFEKNDFEHLAAIDLLLLTQGWRKYDWPEILQNNTSKFKFPYEEAFSIEGMVKNWMKNKADLKSRVSLFSPLNKLVLMTQVDSAGKYKFERVFLADSTWVILSATSDKGRGWNRALQMSIPEYSMGVPDIHQIQRPHEATKEIPEVIPHLTKGVIQLPEVVVTEKRIHPLFYDNPYVWPTDKIVEVTKDNYRQFDNMEMLLRIKFNVTTNYSQDSTGGSSGFYFNMNRGHLSIIADDRALQPMMTIDGMRVYDAQQILDLPIEYVEAVSVNKDGFGLGYGGSGGAVSVITRKTPFFVNDAEATNMKRMMVHGYAAPKKYFTPKYTIVPGTNEYERYATIYWEPELTTDNKNKGSFKFYVPKEITSLNVRAEGISVDGKVFLHEQKIVLPGKELVNQQ